MSELHLQNKETASRLRSPIHTKLFLILSTLIFNSCGLKVSSVGIHASGSNVISGIISPFLGSIAHYKSSSSLIFTEATAAACADPVYARLFKVEADGTVVDSSPLSELLVTSDARYSFDLSSYSYAETGVQFIVKAEGCNGDVYKRPITALDDSQDLNVATTVVAEVINSTTTTKINEVNKKEVESLIHSLTGTNRADVLDSLTNQSAISSKFTQIFGSSPSVILDARPEVNIVYPTSLNELATSSFKINAFHIDPNYSLVYKWKLDGVVKSSSATWNYVPSANDSGNHQVDLYVGQNDGSGNIDLAKPYYTKTLSVDVNNNILPAAPSVIINGATPSPRNTNSISLDLNTGIGLVNCANFSHVAVTETSTPPSLVQFNIDCTTSGTQTEAINFSAGDGTKTLYVWAVDNAGQVSTASSISFVVDTLAPTASITTPANELKGGATQAITLGASDSGTGLANLDLYFSSNGGTSYSLLSNLSTSATTYSWSVPSIDITDAKFKLVATDLTGLVTTVYSNLFTIDSTAPSSPTISRTSAATSNSTTVSISTTCSADYAKILYSQTATTPVVADAGWENCGTTKSFTASSGDGVKTIYAFTKDSAGNISNSSNVTMTLDTTAPSAPVANIASAAISSSTTATFTVTDCLDRPYVLVSESMIAPLVGDSDWQACSTNAAAISYTLIGPVSQGSHTLYVYAKDAVGNISASASASMIYDTTNPTLSLSTSLGLLYKGGDSVALSFGASDTNGLSSFKLEYSTDGVSYALAHTLATSDTTYSWTVPASNTATAKIRLVAADNATTANSTTVYSDTFAVDSTAPTAPTLARTSNAISSSSTVTMTVGSCTDTYSVLITETNTAPSANASGWQLCSTTAGAITATVSGEGAHTLYAWVKDLAQNVATSANSVSMTLDTTDPVIAVTTPSSMQGNVGTGSVSWTLTETNVAASTNFTVEIYNGSSWVSVGTKAATAGVNTAASYTLSNFTVPNISLSNAKMRVSLSDAAGNSGNGESAEFIIDSAAPILSSVTINDGATYAGTALVNVKVNVSDNVSTGSQISVRLGSANASTDDCQSEYANTDWIPWTNASTNFSYTISPTDGNKIICVWAKDSLGNISVIESPSTGTAGVNQDSILFQTGNPPSIASFTAVRTSDSGLSATSGDPLTITWNTTDVEGLDNNPINISYTTDNSVWKDITTNATIDIALNRTWIGGLSGNPTSGSDTLTTFTAPSSNYFKLKIQSRDQAGNTSSFVSSQPFNTGSWSVYAGTKDRGDGGTGRSASLSGEGFTKLFAINPINGDVYASDNLKGIRKLDAKTGLVSTFIASTTLNFPTNGALPANPAIPAGNYNQLTFDSKGRLYIGAIQPGGQGAVIYQIDLENLWVRQYAGGGVADDGGASSTALQVAGVGSFDEQDSMYVWAYCGGTLSASVLRTLGSRIIKISQNPDGSPGTTTRIIGDCTFANPTSGSTAYSQPASLTPYPTLSSIVAWDNGNKIVVLPYSTGMRYKIINGVVYSSNISAPLGVGTGLYNPTDGLLYKTTATGIEKVSINESGANGETATTVFNINSTANGCSSDGVSTNGFCGLVDTQLSIRSGLLYFADGTGINKPSNFAIRYFDSNNQLRTLFGGQPFYGDGLDKNLMRGSFSGIYYKKSNEPNQAAFPEGLYFMERSGLVFGSINPTTGIVTHLWGNQARLAAIPVTGTTMSKDLSMGNAYGGGNGMPLLFDSSGLPWMRINNDAVSVDANKQIVRRTNQSVSTLLQLGATSANPANYGLFVYGGYTNFAIKGNSGLFILPNYVYTGYDPIISIRYMDFANSISPIIIGGNYLASTNTAASADVATPGAVSAAPLSTNCRSANKNCYLNYQSSTDRLYFTEDTKIRYITTPDNTATSTLGTLFTASSSVPYNFNFTPDGSQVWYFKATGGLYCYDISSGKSWCDNTTDHFTIRTSAGFTVSPGANQMTFKDNQTLFVSTYSGEILQFNLPTIP